MFHRNGNLDPLTILFCWWRAVAAEVRFAAIVQNLHWPSKNTSSVCIQFSTSYNLDRYTALY